MLSIRLVSAVERDIFQIAETRSRFKLAYIVKIISNTSLTSSVAPREKKPFDHLNFTLSATIRKHLQILNEALEEAVP